jgi:hypothetical protein
MQGTAQRWALPAGGRDEIMPFYRNQLQATQTAQKRGDSHQSGARCVGWLYGTQGFFSSNQLHIHHFLSTALQQSSHWEFRQEGS